MPILNIDRHVAVTSNLKQAIKRKLHPIVLRLLYYAPFVRLINKPINIFDLGINGNFLVATKRGLYQIRENKLYLLLKGNFYGVAQTKQRIFAFERIGRKGRIITLDTTDTHTIANASVYLRNLSPGCHQMDIYKGMLFVCDTYNNRVLKIDLFNKEIRGAYYPLGQLSNGRQSGNYGHINSIYLRESETFALCHNETTKTHKPSQIIILGHDFSVQNIIDTTSGSAHNIIPWNQSFLHCDSINGSLKLGDETVFDASCFTRGVSITRKHIVLGGSEYANRDIREYGKGYLFVLDRKDYNCLHRTEFPGMVQEIRRLGDVDFGLSENGSN